MKEPVLDGINLSARWLREKYLKLLLEILIGGRYNSMKDVTTSISGVNSLKEGRIP